ncbi:hypothetical protein Tco_0351321 [Tanacetum coccineum]
MQCPQGNPSLSLALQHSQPSMGSSGCVIAKLAKLIRLGNGYRRIGLAGGGTWDSGFAMAETGCNWARIGPSKSSQSLSIAHKWAVEID